MELFKPGRTFNFMGQRRFWVTLSLALATISTVLVFYPGINYGTDFRGGTEVELAFNKPLEAGQLRESVEGLGFKNVDVVQVVDPTNSNHFLVRVQDVTSLDDTAKSALKKALCLEDPACPPEERATEVKFSPGGDKIATRYDSEPNIERIKQQVQSVSAVSLRATPTNPQVVNPRDHHVEIQLQSKGDQLLDGLRKSLGADTVPERALRMEWVGPKAGKQLRDSARNAVAISIVFIMLYLAFRFDLRFAPGVVVACIHDAMVVLGVFVLTRKEVTLSTIAAVLTVVGYSMNDTVVVYDRIRENLTKHRGKSFWDVINLSVSETLSRTILTSGFTMLSMVAFFVWGTGVLKDFAFALVVGIIAGTYSSIYVAAPMTEWFDEQLKKSAAKTKKKSPRARPAPAGAKPAT